MLALLLALLGFGAAATAAGGGQTSTPQPTTPVVDDVDENVVDDQHIEDSGNSDTKDETDDQQVEDKDDTDKQDDTKDETDDQPANHGDNVDDTDSHAEHENTLPSTPEEIAAFVETVRTGVEAHVHDDDSDKLAEHTQVLDLVSPAEATHIAIGHGSWFDPDNWHNGEVPGDDAKVVIPEDVWMEYDGESEVRLFTVRVDGQLDFAVDVDSKMVVDTFVVTPSGTLIIGTEDDPIENDVNVEIVIANNGAIDTDWDPTLLSRGLISHGHTEIHGEIKDSHEKVIEDPMEGDTSVTFDELPEGWEIGDKIVIAGTHYEGYTNVNGQKEDAYNEPEDEVRYISNIDGNTVHFDDPLVHDHDTRATTFDTSVANYSRNVTVRSEDGDESEIFERGHVMLMHSDDVDIRYAAFEELGRTDKSEDVFGTNDELDSDITFDSNVAGRYGLHLHRTGVDDQDNPTILEGNAVYGSPGWGIVHHDSHAILENNATYDTFGAGFVAETGNETGSWTDNIAIDAQGVRWGGAKGINDGDNFGTSGDGFWFSGRMVDASDNIAASVNHGFIYFHRTGGKIDYDADVFELSEVLSFDESASVNETPILIFEDNEAFASRMGLHVVKNSPIQGHDVHSVIDGFTAWSVEEGANLQYTSHYLLKDFDLIGIDNDGTGIGFGKNTFDITILDATITGFDQGLNLKKGWSSNLGADEDDTHEYTVVNANLDGNDTEIAALTDEDNIFADPIEEISAPSLDIDPIYYNTSGGAGSFLEVTGTKTDSLGTDEFMSGPDELKFWKSDIVSLLEENGYYTDETGTDYMVLNIYFSDSLTGDVFVQSELMEFADDVINEGSGTFGDAKFNGDITHDELVSMTGSVTKVRDAEDSDASTVSDFEDHAALLLDMDGEAVMAMLSNGQTLSEALPTQDMDVESQTDHTEMDMF